MTYGLYHQVVHLRRQVLLPFHHRLRQTVTIPEEAILRRAMIGSHAANRREKKSGSMRANQIFCFLSGGGGSRGVTSRSADIFTLHFIQALGRALR